MPNVEICALSQLYQLPGTPVASIRDEFGDVTVIDHQDYRSMSFDRFFEQSKMLKSQPTLPVHNYIRAMLMALALVDAENILMLGLGGGSLLRSLCALKKTINVDVVELRQAVLSVAQDYFHLPQNENIRYMVGDAARFLVDDHRHRHYALIFSDLYNASALAPLQATEQFLYDCAIRLAPGGWLVLNHPQLPPQNQPFARALRKIFSTLFYTVAPSGNVVIFASRSPCPHSLHRLRQLMSNVAADLTTDFTPLAHKLRRWPGSTRHN